MPPYPHPMECQEPVSNTYKSNKFDNKIKTKKWAITKKKKKKEGVIEKQTTSFLSMATSRKGLTEQKEEQGSDPLTFFHKNDTLPLFPSPLYVIPLPLGSLTHNQRPCT